MPHVLEERNLCVRIPRLSSSLNAKHLWSDMHAVTAAQVNEVEKEVRHAEETDDAWTVAMIAEFICEDISLEELLTSPF